MGTTFVTMENDPDGSPKGFWMRDSMLELWLRLLALHLPEPRDEGTFDATRAIRSQWLLASRGYFSGCVPHALPEAGSSAAGREVMRIAIGNLLEELGRSRSPIEPAFISLLGCDRGWRTPVERQSLEDVGRAFLDLLDGRISSTAESTERMPGTKPYPAPRTPPHE